MTFGDFQRQNREAAGMSIYRLAKITNISEMKLGNYENQKSEPTIKNAERICKPLRVTFTIGDTALKVDNTRGK